MYNRNKELGKLKSYQEIFNNTLERISDVVSGYADTNSPLMKSIVKKLFDFSDELIENGIIESRNQIGKRKIQDEKQNY